MKGVMIVSCVLALVFGIVSFADAITVTPDDLQGWVSYGDSNGGSSRITDTTPRSGNGSLEMTGDRTRFGMGDLINGLGSLSDVNAFSFDWSIAADSVSALHPDYTPALRLHLGDGSELIWEGAYNNVYGSVTKGEWYTADLLGGGQTMWRWAGSVTVDDSGAQINQSITDWSTYLNDPSILVLGISVGVGSSAGSSYHAFADNVTLGFTGSDATIYNFETTSAPVPEPSTMFLLSSGLLGLLGLSLRRLRKRK